MEDKDLEKPEAAEETAVQPEKRQSLEGRTGKREEGAHTGRDGKKKEVHCDSGLCAGLPGSHVLKYSLPSGKGKRDGSSRQPSGFNVNVPEPTTAKLLDKKTAAYEKQQAEVEEEAG